ncbi:MAG: carbohydrate porin [Stenotrophomonas sp.]
MTVRVVPLALAIGLAGASLPAMAGESTASKPVESVKQIPLSQDLALRDWLQDRGITPNARVVIGSSYADGGYRGSGAATATHIDLGAVIDTGKALGFDGTLRVVLSDRFGQAANDRYTGSYIQNQAFWGQGQNFRLNEVSYERSFMAARLSLKGGFFSMGNDFGGLPYTCNFNNNGQCGHPLGPIYSSGWLDNPTGQWGLRVKWSAPSGWYAQTGIFDVNPSRKQSNNGFKVALDGNTGLFFPVELGYVHGHSQRDYGGTYKIGYYWDTSNANVLGNPDARQASHRSGEYIQLAQRVWKPEAETVRGISAFAIATQADVRTGLLRRSWELGLSWRGPLRAREDDALSIAWTRLDFSRRLGDYQRLTGAPVQTREQMIELNYGMQVLPWLVLRPSVQYVTRPSGLSERPDAWVYTLQAQATL